MAARCTVFFSSPLRPEEVPCPEGEFSCGTGACVPRSFVCDNKDDCASGLDEFNCSELNDIHSLCNDNINAASLAV